MGPIRRATFAVFLLSALAASAGCDSKTNVPVVYHFETNDYKFEYDGQQKRVTIGAGLMRMLRYPEDIEVSGGRLRVGPREYGTVKRKDKISVVGGKVAVNGQDRYVVSP